MATKTEIKKILKELGLTESDMDNYWNDLLNTNWVVKNLSNAGKTWRDMNSTVIRQLPTQKQRDIERNERKNKEKEEKKAKELKEKQYEEYYNTHFEEIMLQKIDNHEKLTEHELSELAYDYEIERDEGDNRRWSQTITSYVKIKDRFFVINWERELTECQDNEFDEQPYEVEKKTYEKIIPEQKMIVTEWVKK